MKKKVLLTGVSGFLGSHTTIKLLEKGYHVVGTLRNIKRAGEIRQLISQYTEHSDALEFVEAELSDRKIWKELTGGVDYVQHIASPFPANLPKSDDELVVPAREGVLSILEAAISNDVQRVVLTSSSSAVIHGKPKGQESGTFDESIWADESNLSDTTPYYRSKIIAEKAAWDYAGKMNAKLKLTTVLPGGILGPALEQDFSTSANIVLKMLDSSLPAVPKIGFDVVDVRSVADLLILAMERPEAAGHRFIGTSGFLSMIQVADILRSKYPDRKIPKGSLPTWVTRLIALFDKTLQPVTLDLGKTRIADSSKARNLLGWQPFSSDEAVLACAESLLELGIIK